MRLPLFPVARVLLCLLAGILPTHAEPTKDHPPQIADLTARDETDANIARVTADMLQAWHYSHHPFDAEISSKFLDRYVDTLDYFHLYFLQSDLAEFDKYRTTLGRLTVKERDLTPCWRIFARFMERANQRIQYVTNLLDTETMEFTNQDRFAPNRHTFAYATNLDQAREFWRQEVRCEYLDEILKAPGIKFEGRVNVDADGRAAVALSRDKAHPLTFDYLPAKFFGKDGKELIAFEISQNRSNAVARLDWTLEKDRKATNTLYSADGAELGSLVTHRVASALTNNAEAATNRVFATNLEAVIELKQKNLDEVRNTLTNHYGQMLKNYKELDNDRVFEMYMNSLAHAYDPHSDYMGHLQAENFDIQMKLSLFGIGAVLSSEDGYCKITELKEGPAQRSGKIKPDDRIVAVAQSNAAPVNVVGMPLDKVVEMIRGPKNTKVTLTLIPADAADSTVRKTVALVRDEIKLEEQAAKARLYEEPAGSGPARRLGVIDLSSFYADMEGQGNGSKTTSGDVARLVRRLEKEGVDGIILDLRRNGGGYLEEAINLTGLFISKGPVVQTKDPNGDIITESCQDSAPLYDGPLIVLTSRFSASASEILTGALQDYGRALIVGDKSTFGKGSVQTKQSLGPIFEQQHMKYSFDPGSLKVTIKKFYRAGGASTQLNGVVSDIELPSVWSFADVGESSLPNAMPWDDVSSSDPVNEDRVQPYLSDLRHRSEARLATDADFALIWDRVARYKKEMADKTVSLNEKERLAEQKEQTAHIEELKRQHAAQKNPAEKIYEITLKNVDQPNLQPLAVKTNSAAISHEDEFDVDDELGAQESNGDSDPTLDETRRILQDYIGDLGKSPVLTKADPSVPTPPNKDGSGAAVAPTTQEIH